jgi:hypothetical protein
MAADRARENGEPTIFCASLIVWPVACALRVGHCVEGFHLGVLSGLPSGPRALLYDELRDLEHTSPDVAMAQIKYRKADR